MTHYLRSSDFSRDKMEQVFALAAAVKAQARRRRFLKVLEGYSTALVFQKPSLRTRATFDLGMQQLGGRAMYLGPTEIALGVRESVHDVAKNLERWFDCVVARVFAQADVEGLAQHGSIPVINALSDSEHPCQAMADYFTLLEHGVAWKDLRLAFVGDGNNICCSLMIAGCELGVDFRFAGPEGFHPPKDVVKLARARAAASGGRLLIASDWKEAVRGANAVYTDVWASMGQEKEAAERRGRFAPYQVNAAMMAVADKGAFSMHDLPAHRGEEITDEVIDSPQSICFDQAENRLHIQKAILLECLGRTQAAREELATL